MLFSIILAHTHKIAFYSEDVTLGASGGHRLLQSDGICMVYVAPLIVAAKYDQFDNNIILVNCIGITITAQHMLIIMIMVGHKRCCRHRHRLFVGILTTCAIKTLPFCINECVVKMVLKKRRTIDICSNIANVRY